MTPEVPEVVVKVVEPVSGLNPTPGLIPVREVSREELEEEYPSHEAQVGVTADWIKANGKMCVRHGQPAATCTGPSCRIERAERERRLS